MKKILFCALLTALGIAPALMGNCGMKDCSCKTCNCHSKKFDDKGVCKHKKCMHDKNMHDASCSACTGKKGKKCKRSCDKPGYEAYTQKAK